jgi:anti-sigma regulatory factor (Ser/Thr protein kinase)
VARHLADCAAVDDATLIVSELAANAIVHSASRGQFFTVRAELHPDYVPVTWNHSACRLGVVLSVL